MIYWRNYVYRRRFLHDAMPMLLILFARSDTKNWYVGKEIHRRSWRNAGIPKSGPVLLWRSWKVKLGACFSPFECWYACFFIWNFVIYEIRFHHRLLCENLFEIRTKGKTGWFATQLTYKSNFYNYVDSRKSVAILTCTYFSWILLISSTQNEMITLTLELF